MTKREQLIKQAYDYLQMDGNRLVKVKTDNGEEHKYIPKTTKGYIASLGGSIVQAGLLQSIIFFEATKEGREDIIKAIFYILRHSAGGMYSADGFPENKFGEYFANNLATWNRRKVTNDVVEAAVALKMAMRLFPHQ